MHFVVNKNYGNEVEVKLHWESKEKIKKFLWWTFYIVCLSIISLGITSKNIKNKK